MRADLYAAYLILILRHIGMGIMMIVNVVASHAFHFLRISNQAFDANSPCPNVVSTVETVIHLPPVLLERKLENILLLFFSFFF